MAEQMPAPGWYPDPGTPGYWRYWDGRGWTDSAAPIQGLPTSPGAQQAVPPRFGWQPQPSWQASGASTGPRAGAAGWPGASASRSDAYYQRAYAQFEEGGSRVVWNWAAFLFGALWYLFRGMWAKALLYIAVVTFTGGFLAIPVWVYGGLMGTYDDYLLRRRGTQGW